MNLRSLPPAVFLLTGMFLLPSCETSGIEPTGLTRYEREEAYRRRPLTDDPNSDYRNIMVNDGAVGIRVGGF